MSGLGERGLGGGHAGAGLALVPEIAQRQLERRQRRQHVVGTGRDAHGADPQRGRADLVESGADEDAVLLAHPSDHGRRLHALGRADARHRVRHDGGIGEHLEPHGGHAGAQRAAGDGVPARAVGHALLQDQAHGHLQGAREMGRNRDGLPPRGAVGDLAAARDGHPVVAPAQQVVRVGLRLLLALLHGPPGARAHGHQGHAERRRQALLRARHVEVHAPLVGADVEPGDRRHGVEHEERPDRARKRADLGRRIRGAGGGLVVHEGDGLRPYALGLPGQAVHVQARAPLDRELGGIGADAAHDLAHEQAEGAGTHHQHAVARLDHRERARLERGPSRARHDEDLALRLEDVAQGQGGRLQHALVERAVVLDGGGLVHGLDDGERQLRRAGDHEHRTRLHLGPVDRRRHGHLLGGSVRGTASNRRRLYHRAITGPSSPALPRAGLRTRRRSWSAAGRIGRSSRSRGEPPRGDGG